MIKKILFQIVFLLFSTTTFSQTITIIESEGSLESAYIKWLPVTNADSYNVYYTGQGVNHKKIDDQLIRNYDTYFRADVLGLSEGLYTIEIAPVVDDVEGVLTTSSTIIVKAHDRTGFAFSNNRVPGAYKMDGTVKEGAVVLYITQNTKNTISLDVLGANENPCVGLETILEGYKKGSDNRPLIVRFIGQITDFDYMDKGDIVVENKNNSSSYITLEGVGDDAVADGWGIRIKNASNVEIRNMGTMNTDSNEGDNIGLQQGNDYIWIHNCDFFYGGSGGDSDQEKGDGALDCKKSTYVTFSYNHFWDTGKSNLLGLSENTTEGLYITYHHNWFDHSDSRHPRVRFYSAHVYNNYYDGNAKYGVGSTKGSSVFVEANYFRNCKYPMQISMQGSDVFNESTQTNDYSNNPTFSKEDGGIIKAFNNFITGQTRFITYAATGFTAFDSTKDFDAYLATTRNEIVSNNVISNYGNNTYNNFDTNLSIMYNYTPDSPEDAKNNVMKYAGRLNGGDFKWTFNNDVDDTSYAVNIPLKNALINYNTTLISIQGDDESSGNGDLGGDGGTDPNPGDEIHNFTNSGTTSTFYTISGNLSDSKGDAHYNGLTLTQCLKIESSTNIAFTAESESTLLLVFNDGFNGTIKINGEKEDIINGVLEVVIPASSYTITKSVTANLYFMSVISTTLGTDTNSSNVFNVYPNPVINFLNINSNNRINRIEIYNVLGMLVKKVENNTSKINLNQLSKGSYFIKIYADNFIIKKIFLKE